MVIIFSPNFFFNFYNVKRAKAENLREVDPADEDFTARKELIESIMGFRPRQGNLRLVSII